MDREETVGGGAERDVVVKASPSPAFEVVEANFAFHLLVVALDAPSQLHEPYEFFLRDGFLRDPLKFLRQFERRSGICCRPSLFDRA